MLEEAKYHQLVDDLQQKIEDLLESLDFEIDIDNANGVLTLIFENNSQIIVSRQSALRELWLAARSGGYHLSYNTMLENWFVKDTDESINELLQRLIKEQSNEFVDFSGIHY